MYTTRNSLNAGKKNRFRRHFNRVFPKRFSLNSANSAHQDKIFKKKMVWYGIALLSNYRQLKDVTNLLNCCRDKVGHVGISVQLYTETANS